MFRADMFERVSETGIKILLHLNKGRAKLGDFQKKVGISNAAIYHAILILETEGLITDKREGKKRMFELSPLGRRIAEKLAEADEIFIKGRPPQARK